MIRSLQYLNCFYFDPSFVESLKNIWVISLKKSFFRILKTCYQLKIGLWSLFKVLTKGVLKWYKQLPKKHGGGAWQKRQALRDYHTQCSKQDNIKEQGQKAHQELVDKGYHAGTEYFAQVDWSHSRGSIPPLLPVESREQEGQCHHPLASCGRSNHARHRRRMELEDKAKVVASV